MRRILEDAAGKASSVGPAAMLAEASRSENDAAQTGCNFAKVTATPVGRAPE
jgi:hypothetical protein